MAQINLLPWREELRQEKKKEFLTLLLMVCCAAAFVCFLWVEAVQGAVDSQSERNRILQGEIDLLSKKVQEIKDLKKRRRELIDRMRVIQDLEGKRSIIVHYFDELARAVPDGIFFTHLERVGDVITITGVSESNQRISTLMRKLDESDWFANPNLKSVVAAPELGEQAGTFSMSVNAILRDAEEKGDK